MKTSVNLYVNNENSKEKLDVIKKLGYDEFYTGMYDVKESMSWKEQLDYARKIGLRCTMMHCSYYEPRLDNFWLNNDDGELVANDYIHQIEQCGEYVDNFVVHLNGSKNSTLSKIGLERLERILDVCEKYDVNLCIENLYSSVEIPYIFEHIQNPYLKICYDAGHKNFLTPDFDICEIYAQYISVLHLHENDGTKDEHKKLTKGSKVYSRLVDELPLLNSDVVLSSEIKVNDQEIDWKEYLKSNLDSLKSLAKDIENKKEMEL